MGCKESCEDYWNFLTKEQRNLMSFEVECWGKEGEEEARESWAFLKCSLGEACGTSRRLSNKIGFQIGPSGQCFEYIGSYGRLDTPALAVFKTGHSTRLDSAMVTRRRRLVLFP